jgi:hypothetical protein
MAMVCKATFNNSYIMAVVLLVRKPEYLEKTSNLPQATDKLIHIIILYTSPRYKFELATSVVLGTDYIGSYTIQLTYDQGHDDP